MTTIRALANKYGLVPSTGLMILNKVEQIATDKNRKRIAEELFIELETVKSHIKNIYHELNSRKQMP